MGDQVDDTELGEPVTELKDLALAVDDRFGRKVRGRIERRALAGEFVGLAWTAPIMMLLELLRAPFELFRGKRRM
ncbi:MAG TPA: hypothetical protein PKW63_18745 [Vicinamibacterales bacterium]|nr:hypothetical protein [Vicinamibacterales bacterium]